MLERDSMLFWLAKTAVQAREAAGRKQVHIAASANRDQSSIYRFEQAAKGQAGWPRDPDRIVAAYADDLDISPIELWEQALHMWREDLESTRVVGAFKDGAARAGPVEPPDAPE